MASVPGPRSRSSGRRHTVMVDTRHPRCNCGDDSTQQELATLMLAKFVEEHGVGFGATLGLCHRQLLVAMAIVGTSMCHKNGSSEDEMRTEMGEALEVALAV